MEEKEILTNEQSESGEQESIDGMDLIATINDYKKNTVSREQYEKVQKENKDLLKALIDGGQVAQPEVPQKSIEELRNELFSKEAVEKGMTNLEFVEKSLILRDAIIASGGGDPFLPVGKGIEITREDYEAAEFTAQQYRECIELAKGNSEVFTAELARRTVDNSIPTAKNKSYYRR